MCLGTLGRITRCWDEGGVPMAQVDAGASSINACLLYHPDAVAGADVLVHMGFVVDVLDEESARDARSLRAHLRGS